MKNLVFILCFIAYLGTQAQTEKPDFKWLTVEEAGAAFAKEPKPIFINFFETGNDSCQLMVDSVYSNPTIVLSPKVSA